MKMELRIAGKIIVIESEGEVSVHVWDEQAVVVAPVGGVENVPSAAPASVATSVVEVEKVTEEVQEIEKENTVNADSLFAKLVQLRRELAMSANVPPYVIFNDKSLREMAEKLPQDLAAFGNISGVGKAKLEKYGDTFLSVICGGAA